MTALGISTLQFQIADFKFLAQFHHMWYATWYWNTIWHWCTEEVHNILAWDQEKNCYIQKEGRLLTYTRNCEQRANVTIVKSTLNILPRDNGIIPMKIKGHTIEGPYWPIPSVIRTERKGGTQTYTSLMESKNIKGRTYVNVLVSNYTSTHVTFNKGEQVGHLELPIEDMHQIPEDSGSLTAHSITTKRMMAKRVEPDIFKLPHHKLKNHMETKLEEILKEYKSQFAQDETTIRTTPLIKMTIDTEDSEPGSQKHHPIAMKHYKWVKDEINQLTVKGDMRKPFQLVSTHHIGTKRRWRKTSSHWLLCTQQDHMNIYLAYAEGRRHFFPTEWH